MFKPKRVLFEKGTLETEMGQKIYNKVKDDESIEIINLTSNRIKEHIPGENAYQQYRSGKETMVVGVRKTLKFQTCKPSANYQLPLVTGCMGRCEYCYLNTQLGDKPFIKVFVNTEEILDKAKKYIEERQPQITIFEGAATSDPVAVEPYTDSLRQAIQFFAKEEKARFRFVTKYNDVDGFLDIEHNNHTEIRFSINTDYIIKSYEHFTASVNKRIEAAIKVAKVGYKIGFIIAPVFIYDGWKEDYENLIKSIKEKIPDDLDQSIIFEVISHRYTTKAKNTILQIYPETTLPMNEDDRKFKYGQFGYGKYVYSKEELEDMKNFFKEKIEEIIPNSIIKYII